MFKLSYFASSFRINLMQRKNLQQQNGLNFLCFTASQPGSTSWRKTFFDSQQRSMEDWGPTPCAVIRSAFFCSFIICSSFSSSLCPLFFPFWSPISFLHPLFPPHHFPDTEEEFGWSGKYRVFSPVCCYRQPVYMIVFLSVGVGN